VLVAELLGDPAGEHRETPQRPPPTPQPVNPATKQPINKQPCHPEPPSIPQAPVKLSRVHPEVQEFSQSLRKSSMTAR